MGVSHPTYFYLIHMLFLILFTVQELKINISNNPMVSFYVLSLFTKISLHESIILAVSYIACLPKESFHVHVFSYK